MGHRMESISTRYRRGDRPMDGMVGEEEEVGRRRGREKGDRWEQPEIIPTFATPAGRAADIKKMWGRRASNERSDFEEV